MPEGYSAMKEDNRISKGSQSGPGRELHGVILGCLYSKTATGQKTLSKGRGPYLRGPADDVTLCHYSVCGTCQRFGDAFDVTAPATVAHICEQQHRFHVQTRHRRGVTKARGP